MRLHSCSSAVGRGPGSAPPALPSGTASVYVLNMAATSDSSPQILDGKQFPCVLHNKKMVGSHNEDAAKWGG